MKKILLGVASLLFLVLGAAVVAPFLMDWSQYKEQALTQVKAMTGHDVALNGDFSISLLPSPKAYARDIIVKAPAGSSHENLASIGQVDLHLAIAPLFSGKIAISSVSLVDPVVAIEVLADGRQSWQTPELDALMAPKPESGNAAATGKKSSAMDVSIQNFTVKNGSFAFLDKKAGTDFSVLEMNLFMNADSLSGPFKGQGDLLWNDQKLSFEAQTGSFGGGSDSVAVNAKFDLAGAIHLEYAGVLGVKDGVDLQGETSLKISDLQKMASTYGVDLKAIKAASLDVRGVLNATPAVISMKDMTLDLAGNKFSGALEGDLSSGMQIKAALEAEKSVNLDTLFDMGAVSGGAGASSANTPASGGGFLPKTIALPGVNAAVSLKAPAVVYKGEEYRSVSLNLQSAPGSARVGLDVGSIPGQGKLNLDVTVKQEAGKSPAVSVALKADSKNLPYTLESMGVGVDPKSVERIKTAAADVTAAIYKDRVDFSNSSVTLDGSPLAFSGSYALSGSNGKPVLRLNAAAGTLDVNAFMPASAEGKSAGEEGAGSAASSQAPQDLKKTLAEMSLPFDFDFDLSAENLKVQDYSLKGLAASGQWIKNSVVLEGLSVKDFAGAALQAKGKVENIQSLNGVDLTVGAQANDVVAVAKVLGLDASSLPSNLGRTDISAALKGGVDNLGVLANIKALNGEVIVQGAVADPLGQMKADKLGLQVKHRSVNEAINIFSPGSGGYASLNGPLDLYTDIQIADGVTQMNNIKARLAGASLQGQLSVKTGSSKPNVSGSLVFDDLIIQSSSVSSAPSGKGGASSSGAPQWSREAIDTAWMHSIDFDVSLSGSSLKYEGWDLGKPVIKAKLSDGMLMISQMDAGMFDGQIAMKASVQAGKGERQPLQVQGDAKIRDVSLEPLVKAFVGSQLIKGSGRVSLDSVVNASGISPAALVYDLSGNGEVTGKDIVLDGLDLTRFAKALSEETKPGDTVLGLWKGASKGGSTRFDTLDGDYTINEGVIQISKLDLDGSQAMIATTGKIDLPKWFIDTDHKILVKGQDVPEFTVEISGPLDNPGNTFGQGVLNNYLQRKLERKLEGVLQDKLGGKLDGKLGGALGTLLGVPTAQQPQAQQPQTPQQTQQTAPAAQATTTTAPASVNDNEPASGQDTWQAPASAPVQQAPVQQAPVQSPQPTQQQPKEIDPEEAVKGLIKGLLQ